MTRLFHAALFLLVVAVLALTACYLSGKAFHTTPKTARADYHNWIHQHLMLTPAQDKALEPSELHYKEAKENYIELIRLANMELAQAILDGRGGSVKVTAALEKINQTQGDLQRATLEHVFNMKDILTPEQYDKLLNMTANALYQVENLK